MNKKELKFTLSAEVLLYFFAFVDFLPRPFEHKMQYAKRLIKGKANTYPYYRVMRSLEQRGLLKIYRDADQKKYSLTAKGKLEALFIKARMPQSGKWDGKWRMVLFDIPEDARQDRNKLRNLLKTNGFKQLQKSVFINPYSLHRDAIIYLQRTGLDKYIQIFRVDEAANHKQLEKLFF